MTRGAGRVKWTGTLVPVVRMAMLFGCEEAGSTGTPVQPGGPRGCPAHTHAERLGRSIGDKGRLRTGRRVVVLSILRQRFRYG